MQNPPEKRIPASIFLIPILSLLAYLAANSAFFTAPYQEVGDYAANALQIWKAGQFQETLGAYSRFLVNHPGPIVFYYLAGMEKLLFFVKSPHGAHEVAIVFYNLGCILLGLKLLLSRTGEYRSAVLLLVSVALGLSPLMPGILSNIWGPGVILFPTLLFLLSLADFANGSIRNFFWLTVASNLIVQNQIVGVSFVFPMLAIGSVYFYKKDGFSDLKDGRSKLIILFSLLLTIVCWIPPLVEQFTTTPGNITKVLTLAVRNSTFHKLGPTFQYVLSYYVSPLPFLKEVPPLLITGFLFAIPIFGKDRLGEFDRRLLVILLWGFALTLFGGFKMKGGQISHVYWFTYIFAAVLYYLVLRVLTKDITFPSGRPFLVYGFSITILCFALYGKNTEFQYDDRPEKFIEAIHPAKDARYKIVWKSDPKDFKQGDLAMGIVLRLVRNGYNACLNEEWSFLVRDSFRCSNIETVRTISLETPAKESETFQSLEEGSFLYKSTILRIAK